jgi:hypothetical protein
MKLTAPLKSRRVQDISPEVRNPTPFEVVGGWGEATSPNTLPEDMPSEREQRSAGATALAAHYEQRRAEQREATDRALSGVQRGHDFTRGLRYREPS